MTRRTLTAMYATRDDAEAARRALVDRGLIPQDIDIIDQNDWAEGASGEPVRRDGGEHKGFFRSLKDMLVPDRDREAYAEGLGRGHFLLTAQVDESLHDQAEQVLERTNAVDLPGSERRPEERRALSEQEGDLEYPTVRVRSYTVVVARLPDEDTDYLRP